ncbi:hypothetical protein [Tumebacillus permanentifrigoris]|uniref:Uncharacterized protein n=1 Tax=Tumebacillus permanentifrigoris TaxID=378543 RepID=A0A316D3B5_9BACL|nr:hypothetical protein [Tumebacillus permanentifrigoris]PWK05294.1 hypothetical protein C7459_12443 [Tumebacillus permanentifrigoris]
MSIHSNDQFYEALDKRVEELVEKKIEALGCRNADNFADGKVVSVSGKVAAVRINLDATAATIPVAPHVGALVAGDEVIVLCRSLRDKIVISKKII